MATKKPTKKPAKKPARKKLVLAECPNPGRAFSLLELVAVLKDDKIFAEFFFNLLKNAEGGNSNAIACVNSYLAPTEKELRDLGIPESKIDSMRKCTESGLLVVVSAQQSAQRSSHRR